MDDRTWERWSALGGIAFVVLVALTAFLPGEPPKVTDSAAKIATFFADKESELRWSAFIGGLAFLAVFWWAGAVWRLMRRGEGGVPRLAILAVGGLVFANAMAGLAGLINSAVAMRTVAGVGGAQSAKTFYVIGWVIGGAVAFGVAAFLFGFSAVIIRSGVLPRALGWFGAVLGVVALASGATVASTRDVFFALSLIMLVGFLLWILIASVLMLRSAPASATTSAS
jgi:hypothetical protein